MHAHIKISAVKPVPSSRGRWYGAGMKRGFTLVEMLVVIGIMVILASLILTGLNVARYRARMTRARRDVAQLVTAWTAYYSDYSRFPVISAASRLNGLDAGLVVTGHDVVQILRGRENFGNQNRRRIPYMDFHQNTTVFLDPWGEPYRIVWDDDYDGVVSVPGEPQSLRMSLVVWSAGEDGVDGTKDDVRSWRPSS